MSIFKQRERLLALDQLIRLQATGKPKVVACRLGVAESSFYNLLKVLKELAAEKEVRIEFNQNLQSYYYTEPMQLKFTFEPVI